MNRINIEKFAPLSGIGSVLLLVTATGFLGVYDYLPTADRLMEAFSSNSTKIILIGYLGLLSSALLMWFAGSIFKFFSKSEGGSHRLSMVAFGGCIASGISLGLGFSGLVATGARLGASGGITPAGIVTLYDLYGTILGQMAAFTFAVFIDAAGIIVLRNGMYRKWFGWISVVIALGLISPIGYFILAFALVWLLGISISLYLRERKSV